MSSRSIHTLRGGYICICILFVVVLTGCSNSKTPVDPEIPGSSVRMVQAFPQGYQWGITEAYSLDSSTTTWVQPIPDFSGYNIGDIAMEDIIHFQEISPLVTAIVRHDNTEAPSYVELIIADITNTPVFSSTIFASSALTNCPVIFCRHPVVEVAYSREGPNMGFIQVHIIWQQLCEVDPSEHWDLFYKFISFEVTESGVNWVDSIIFETVRLPFCTPESDEIQPDICIVDAFNDLYVVYNHQEPMHPEATAIKVARHRFEHILEPPVWEYPLDVAQPSLYQKGAASIDAGVIQWDPTYIQQARTVAVVWCEEIEDNYGELDWQVFYNSWFATANPNMGDIIQVTDFYEFTRPNALPKIDITPASSDIHQAVIAWFSCWPGLEGYHDFKVNFKTTPFVDYTYGFYSVDGMGLCPDLACFQMNDDWHRFGISHYDSTGGTDVGSAIAQCFEFQIDWSAGKTLYVPLDYQVMPNSNGVWDSGNPFTGTSICLRFPNSSFPETSIFGVGWVEDDYYARLSSGNFE